VLIVYRTIKLCRAKQLRPFRRVQDDQLPSVGVLGTWNLAQGCNLG
jgi:hypothetical protein